MNNTIIFMLGLLELFSDLIELTFDAGVVARQGIVPALVFVYVCGEYAWNAVTPVFDWYTHHTPLVIEVH